MAQPPVYQIRNPAPRAMPLPQRGADSFGAEIGAGVEALGRAGTGAVLQRMDTDRRVAAIEDQRQLERQQTEAALEFAKFQARQGKARIDARNNPAPGAEGHTASVLKGFDEDASQVTAKFTDPRVSQWLSERVADYRGSSELSEYEYEVTSRTTKQFDDLEATVEIGSNTLYTNPDVAELATSIRTMSDTIDTFAGPEEAKTKAKRQYAARLARSTVEGLAERDPVAARALLDSGRLNPFIDADSMKAIGSFVGARIRSAAAEAKADMREQAKALGDQVEDYERGLDAGIPAERGKAESMIAAAEQAGRPELAERVRLKSTQSLVVTGLAKAAPNDVRAYISEIDQRIAADPNDVTARAQRKAAEQFQGQMKAGLKADPLAWASRQGLIALDPLADGASAEARAAAASKVQAHYGLARVPVLTAEEADTLASGIAKGADARRQALGVIGGFGRYATAAIGQIAGKDRLAGHAAWLATGPAGVAKADAIYAGRDALKANKDLVPEDEARSIYERTAGNLFKGPGQAQTGSRQIIFEAARAIYAARYADGGGRIDGTKWDRAIQEAAGATDRADGTRQGGLYERDGMTILLPRWMAGGELDRLADSAPIGQWRKALGGALPDFNAIPDRAHRRRGPAPDLNTPRQLAVLQGSYLVDAGEGRYFLSSSRDGRQLLTLPDGRPAVLDMRLMAGR